MIAMQPALHLLALALACAALAVAIGALLARSLFAMCMNLGAAGALTAAAILAMGEGDGALVVALFAAVWAPILLLAAMLLSARAAKPKRGGAPWLSALSAAAVAAGMWFIIPDLAPAPADSAAPMSMLGAWLAPLLLATAAASVGLLGYGERGALQRRIGDAP